MLQTLEYDHASSIKAWTEVAENRLDKFRSGKMEAIDCMDFIDSLRTRDG
ncbi:MAG: hypothetical protein ACLFMP_00435 [Desulfonatronovibrionaceae bacterium]